MKKLFLMFLASFALLFLFSGIAYAEGGLVCMDTDGTDPNASGLVPCGVSCIAPGGQVVICGTKVGGKIIDSPLGCPCELRHFFIMILRVYNFLVWIIAFPVAALMIVIGGILILTSGGPGASNPVTGVVSPNLYSTAKNMIWGAVIALILILGSWLIIDVVLKTIGYVLPWNKF